MSDRWMFPESLAGNYCGKQYKQLGRYPVPATVRSLIRGENLPALDQRCVAPVSDWPQHRARPYLVWTVVAEIDVLLDNVWQYLVAVAGESGQHISIFISGANKHECCMC